NLTATPVACGVYSLVWTTSGDDYGSGRAYEYEIRTASDSITLGNFSSKSLVAIVTPLVSGSSQSFVTGVATSKSNPPWFAILARDSVGTLADTLALHRASALSDSIAPATTT